ncbi:MAG: CvpA family protein [Firmicutes bacterium]|nr:CvpA family protein [Bacillota bacterium]
MVGRGIDFVLLVLLALGLLKGFRKGLVRELFGLVGAVLAVLVAFHGYQGLALILSENYGLDVWQAQAIAFVVLMIGISLLGVFLGYLGSKAISLTPFSLLDHLGGAVFGLAKVGVVVLALLIILGAVNLAVLNVALDQSVVVQQISVLIPFVFEYLDEYWPNNWQRPDWLFPGGNPAKTAGFLFLVSFGIPGIKP